MQVERQALIGGSVSGVPKVEGQAQTKWPPRVAALAQPETRVTSWQRALAGQGKPNAVVMPIKLCIKLSDESGTQDPDRPSGWWDVQAVESQCA